jgi:hypothetical protein
MMAPLPQQKMGKLRRITSKSSWARRNLEGDGVLSGPYELLLDLESSPFGLDKLLVFL